MPLLSHRYGTGTLSIVSRNLRRRICRHSRISAFQVPERDGGRSLPSDYHELKTLGYDAHRRANELLPKLEQAKNQFAATQPPLQEAESLLKDASSRRDDLQHKAEEGLHSIRYGTIDALGGLQDAEGALLHHHATAKLDDFRNQTHFDAEDWRVFPAHEHHIAWIPGARMVTQLAACRSFDKEFAIAVVAVSGPFLEQRLRGLSCHWGAAPHADSAWTRPPAGWHTMPSVSHVASHVASETPMSSFAPLMGSQTVEMANVFSIVFQLPLEGPLELEDSGIKYVLKRTDNQPPEWVKPHNHRDFFLSLYPAVQYFERQRIAKQRALMQHLFEGPSSHRSYDSDDLDVALIADGLEEWGWARCLSDESECPTELQPTADAEIASRLEGLKEGDDIQEIDAYVPPDWIGGIDGWAVLPQESFKSTLSNQMKVQQYKSMLKAIESSTGSSDVVSELVGRCGLIEGMLQSFEDAEGAAKMAQQRRDQLLEDNKSACDSATQLQYELNAVLDTARRAAVALRGRCTEITSDDLHDLCSQLAHESKSKLPAEGTTSSWWPFSGKDEDPCVQHLIGERMMNIAGMDANVCARVFIEGHQVAPPEPSSDEEEDVEVNKGPHYEYDTIVVAIAAAEEFPDGRLAAPLHLHFGVVAYEHREWQSPPPGWSTFPSDKSIQSGTAISCPFQAYQIASKEGKHVFVDPMMFGTVVRLPLRPIMDAGLRGITFVLHGQSDQWLYWQHGNGQTADFYIEIVPRDI